MAKKKLQRFADLKTFANVQEYPENMQGKWGDFFRNNNPIVLELACGRGEYTVGLAKLYADKNFLGVDIKGNRIYIGAKKCLDEKIINAGFLRTQIAMLPKYFNTGEITEIWIIFPDPQLRTSKADKRLTHPYFLRLYQQILKVDGHLHLKTDSPKLYQFTKRVIELYQLILLEDIADVYATDTNNDLKIKTHYERLDIAQSNTIYYLKFKLPPVIIDIDNQFMEELKFTEKINSIS